MTLLGSQRQHKASKDFAMSSASALTTGPRIMALILGIIYPGHEGCCIHGGERGSGQPLPQHGAVMGRKTLCCSSKESQGPGRQAAPDSPVRERTQPLPVPSSDLEKAAWQTLCCLGMTDTSASCESTFQGPGTLRGNLFPFQKENKFIKSSCRLQAGNSHVSLSVPCAFCLAQHERRQIPAWNSTNCSDGCSSQSCLLRNQCSARGAWLSLDTQVIAGNLSLPSITHTVERQTSARSLICPNILINGPILEGLWLGGWEGGDYYLLFSLLNLSQSRRDYEEFQTRLKV